MSVKEEVLRILNGEGGSVSGEKLAASLSVSRNAVWKAVASLRAQGYDIEGCPNKGYSLKASPDILSAESLRAGLDEKNRDLKILVYPTIDSTNSEAKRLIAGGLNENALIVANEQTAGRGRRGRSFYSPASKGIYMTLALCPQMQLSEAAALTTAAAVAVTRAVEGLSGKHVEIKWVNDVYLNGKKICGILTEAISDFESGGVQSVLIGIGVNLHAGEFPEELRESASALETHLSRSALIAAITNEMMKLFNGMEDKAYLDTYREHSMVIGREVNYYEGAEPRRAYAVDIDDTGALIVRHPDGSMRTLSGGEITLRVV